MNVVCIGIDELKAIIRGEVVAALKVQNEQPEEIWYTIRQVAQMASVSEKTITRHKELVPVKFGGAIRYKKSDVDKFLSARE